LGRSYQTISQDLTRVMNRLKALYRGWGIPCASTQVYAARYREEWLNKIPQAGVRRRAELLYQQLDGLQALRRNLRPEFLAESRSRDCCTFAYSALASFRMEMAGSAGFRELADRH
jgi:hypothetical protein